MAQQICRQRSRQQTEVSAEVTEVTADSRQCQRRRQQTAGGRSMGGHAHADADCMDVDAQCRTGVVVVEVGVMQVSLTLMLQPRALGGWFGSLTFVEVDCRDADAARAYHTHTHTHIHTRTHTHTDTHTHAHTRLSSTRLSQSDMSVLARMRLCCVDSSLSVPAG